MLNALNKDAITSADRENINWSKTLEDTITKALNGMPNEDKADLETEYFDVFGTQKALTPIQKEILDLNKLTIKEHFDFYKNKDMRDNDAMKQVAKERNVSKTVSSWLGPRKKLIWIYRI